MRRLAAVLLLLGTAACQNDGRGPTTVSLDVQATLLSRMVATNLGTLGGPSGRADDINNIGEVVGASTTTSGTLHAFLWTQAQGGMRDLGTLGGGTSEAFAINESSTIVGNAALAGGQIHAMSWTRTGGMVDLGTLGGPASYARGVNDLGQIVGYGRTASNQFHAFLKNPGEPMIDLGTLGGPSSRADAINNSGVVVGQSTTPSGQAHAFLWTPAGGMQDLGTLGGAYSAAYAINERGEIAGSSRNATNQLRAFYRPTGGPMRDIGSRGGNAEAFAINELSHVVGYADDAANLRSAIYWAPDGTTYAMGACVALGVSDSDVVVGSRVSCLGNNLAPNAAEWTIQLTVAPPAVPLMDMGTTITYLGYPGGLYPNGANTPPDDHLAAGIARGLAIRRLSALGQPDSNGKYVLMSVGMSMTTQEWCSAIGSYPCDSWTFTGQAAADTSVSRGLVIANGATGGRPPSYWDQPTDPIYDFVRNTRLSPLGVSELQVQAIWLKQANSYPTVSLPARDADAILLERSLGMIVRALKVRYPNLQLVFFTSRNYGGYAVTSLSPEPFAYEGGFSVKWLVEAQITQMQTGVVDPIAGDLNYNTGRAPWIGWGVYIWANGLQQRSDGVFWRRSDFEDDGIHPMQVAETRIGRWLLNFFKTQPMTRCWFVNGGTCN